MTKQFAPMTPLWDLAVSNHMDIPPQCSIMWTNNKLKDITVGLAGLISFGLAQYMTYTGEYIDWQIAQEMLSLMAEEWGFIQWHRI